MERHKSRVDWKGRGSGVVYIYELVFRVLFASNFNDHGKNHQILLLAFERPFMPPFHRSAKELKFPEGDSAHLYKTFIRTGWVGVPRLTG